MWLIDHLVKNCFKRITGLKNDPRNEGESIVYKEAGEKMRVTNLSTINSYESDFFFYFL